MTHPTTPLRGHPHRVLFTLTRPDGDLFQTAENIQALLSQDGAPNRPTTLAPAALPRTGVYALDLTAEETDAATLSLLIHHPHAAPHTQVFFLYPHTDAVPLVRLATGTGPGEIDLKRGCVRVLRVEPEAIDESAFKAGALTARTLAPGTLRARHFAPGALDPTAFAPGALEARALDDTFLERIAQIVWAGLRGTHHVPDSFGHTLTQIHGATLQMAQKAGHVEQLDGDLLQRIGLAVWNALDQALMTGLPAAAPIATLLELSARAAHDAEQVTDLSAHAQAQIAHAVHDARRDDHTAPGTFGEGAASVRGPIAGDVLGDVRGTVESTRAPVPAVTGTVGGVRGDVAGHLIGDVRGSLLGSVESVRGSVRSVEQGVTATRVEDRRGFQIGEGGLPASALAQSTLHAIADAILTRDLRQIPGLPPLKSLWSAVQRLLNRRTVTANKMTVTREDDETVAYTIDLPTDLEARAVERGAP